MKKEKTVKTHTRKLKSGKQVTVKQHTASYDAADVVADVLKKKGAGGELEQLKRKKAVKPEPVEKEDIYSEYGFTKDEFAEWYEGTGSKADKKVEKILRKAMGRKAYNELSDSAADNYRKGGANSFFKKSLKAMKETTSSGSSKKGGFDNSKGFKENFPKELHKYLDAGDFCLKKKPTKEVTKAFKAAGFDIKYNPVEGLYEPVDSKTGLLYREDNPTKSAGGSSKKEKTPTKEPTKKSKLSLPTDGQFEALQKALDRRGYYVHRTSSGSFEVYKKGDRKALKNLKAAISYSEGPVSWGPNKDLEKSLGGVVNKALADGLKEKSTPKTMGTKLTATQNRLISSQDQTDKLPKSFGEFAGKRIESLMTDKGTFAAKFRREYPEFCKAYSAEYKRRRAEREAKQAVKPTKRYKKDYELGPDGETHIVHKEVTSSQKPRRPRASKNLKADELREVEQLRNSIEKLTKTRDKYRMGTVGYGEAQRKINGLRDRLNELGYGERVKKRY